MIGFLAKRNKGKDTAADYLVDQGYTKYAFAYPLKRGVQEWFGFTDEQLYTDKKEEIDDIWGVSPRQVFQFMGTEIVREILPKKLLSNIGENFWVKSVDNWYENNMDKHDGLVVLSDVRYQNEVDYILNKGGKVYKIERPNINNTTNIDTHLSEVELEKIENYTDVIINDGTIKDFQDKLRLLLLY